jgi:hypothetical protein
LMRSRSGPMNKSDLDAAALSALNPDLFRAG